MKLYGHNGVVERLRTNPRSIKKIFLEEGYSGTASIRKKVKPFGIPVQVIPSSKMAKIGRAKNTQGVIMEVEAFAYIPYDELLATALEKKRCLVFLDGLKDPQNLGALIRSLACLGKFSLVLPSHESVPVTESALRVASGGENYIQVSVVANLSKAIRQAKKEGVWIVGAVTSEGSSLWETEMPYPIGLVIGAEQKGIRPVIQKLLDVQVRIPMYAQTVTLNAAQAATVLGYEIMRQQHEYIKNK